MRTNISTELINKAYNDIFPNGKLCTACNTYKDFSSFSYARSLHSYIQDCKKCNSIKITKYNTNRDYSSPINMIKYVIFPNMKASTKSRNKKRPERKLIVEFTNYEALIDHLKEMGEWDLFVDKFNKYIESGRDRNLAPSIDRINNDIGYCVGNLQVVTCKENVNAPRIHSSSSITLTGKFRDCIRYNKINFWYEVNRVYINNGNHITWKSVYPTYDIAKEYSTIVLHNILMYGNPIIPEVQISDWGTLYPEHAIQRKLLMHDKKKVHGHIKKTPNGYTGIIKVNDTVYSSIFPTYAIAVVAMNNMRKDSINGIPINTIGKRDWVFMGYTEELNIQETMNMKSKTTRLTYRHKGVTAKATITEEWQRTEFINMLLKTIKATNTINPINIKLKDWYNYRR